MEKFIPLGLVVILLVFISGCTGPSPECSDGTCESRETADSCPEDCGCTPSWQCTTWSDCINEQQTRACTDLNDCGTNEGKPPEVQTCEVSQNLELDHTEYLGSGARPEIFFNNNMFFLVYLSTQGGKSHMARVYNSDFSIIIKEDTIVGVSSFGSPTDIRGEQDGDLVYLAYETSNLISQEAHIFLTVRNLDSDFSVKIPGRLIATGAMYETGTSYEDEYLNDPAVYLKDNSLFILTHIPTGVQPGDDTIYVLRELDPSDPQEAPSQQLSLGDVLNGLADVSNWFEKEGITYGIFPNIINLGVTHSLRLISFDSQFQNPTIIKDLVATGVNIHPTGLIHWNSMYFLAHSNKATTDPCGAEEDREVWLRSFDEGFNLVQEIKLNDLGIHPTLATDGEKLYLAYSTCGELKVAVFQFTQ